MTVGELTNLLRGLPWDRDVVVGTVEELSDGLLVPVEYDIQEMLLNPCTANEMVLSIAMPGAYIEAYNKHWSGKE